MISHLFIGSVLMCPFLFYASILSTTIILSTQPAPKVILSTQLCHSICSQSLNFTAFDRIINIGKPLFKCHNPLEIRAFSHTYFSTLDINTTHSTWHERIKSTPIIFFYLQKHINYIFNNFLFSETYLQTTSLFISLYLSIG